MDKAMSKPPLLESHIHFFWKWTGDMGKVQVIPEPHPQQT